MPQRFPKQSAKDFHPEVLKLFDPKGIPYTPPSATTFSDLYKWTMMPVIRKLETFKNDKF